MAINPLMFSEILIYIYNFVYNIESRFPCQKCLTKWIYQCWFLKIEKQEGSKRPNYKIYYTLQICQGLFCKQCKINVFLQWIEKREIKKRFEKWI